jgi:cytosine/adenosine deaminase-related metal-dependent hydrolase
MLILAARYLLPVSQPPIRDGALVIEGPRILAVGSRVSLRRQYPEAAWRDLGEAIILPGLVNVHTHVELSALRGDVPPGHSFVDWVLNLLTRRRSLSWEAYLAAAEDGAAELARSGTTCVGDVTATGASVTALRSIGLRAVVYREVIGLRDAGVEQMAEAPFAHLAAMREEVEGSSLEVGVSPHATYSVSPGLFRLCRDLQQRLGLKAAIHMAESSAEIEYLRSGTGEIRTRLLPATGWGDVSPPVLGTTPVQYLHHLGFLDPQCLVIHAVHLTEADLGMLAQTRAAVAHCPRSNAYLDVGRAPLKALRDLGVPVGLGTDSLASAESLSLWDEIRFAHQVHGGLLSPAAWIRMATAGGARALGLDREIGTLEPAKRADLTAIALDGPEGDPYEFLLHEANAAKVLLTMVEGRRRYDREAS